MAKMNKKSFIISYDNGFQAHAGSITEALGIAKDLLKDGKISVNITQLVKL
jgi:hypothetical protein